MQFWKICFILTYILSARFQLKNLNALAWLGTHHYKICSKNHDLESLQPQGFEPAPCCVKSDDALAQWITGPQSWIVHGWKVQSWSLGLKYPVTMSKTSCFITYFSISWIMLCYIYLSTIQTIIKYLFICKWKQMKILKDKLIVRLSVICTFGITFWLTYVNKFWSGGKEKQEVNKLDVILI